MTIKKTVAKIPEKKIAQIKKVLAKRKPKPEENK